MELILMPTFEDFLFFIFYFWLDEDQLREKNDKMSRPCIYFNCRNPGRIISHISPLPTSISVALSIKPPPFTMPSKRCKPTSF